MSLTRRGFTLLEVLVAAILTGLLATLTATLLTQSAARLRERSRRVAAEHAIRVAASAVRSLLEASEARADISMMSATGMIARVTRGSGVICQWSGSEVLVRRGISWWEAIREPVAGRDSLLIGRLDSTGWIVVPLSASPRSGLCPDGGQATALAAPLDTLPAGAIGPGSPLRFFEPVELRLYSSAGFDWVGLRLVATGEAIQPLAGPFVRVGLMLEYFALDGGPAARPEEIAAVRFRLVALVEGGGSRDSAEGFVTLKGGW